MKTIEEQVALRKLQPTTEGNWLYNENANTFSQLVYLAKDDDGSGWSEITEDEKIELEEVNQVNTKKIEELENVIDTILGGEDIE